MHLGSDRPRSTERSHFRFCPRCGHELSLLEVDDRTRAVCPRCGFVHYRNPVVGVAGVVTERSVLRLLGEHTTRYGLVDPDYSPALDRERILLARRAISFRGRWCIPCGYVEFDEEVREALVREMAEETGLVVQVGRVLAVESNFHLPDEQSVGIWFEAIPTGGRLRPGDDVDALAFVDPAGPTPDLAFPTDRRLLERLAAYR
ncbi:MAG: NUDIX domain-containing protein [Candidatus Eisenbacteria bacterium]